mmetsp:Transcript_16253/g.29572  ORF Transcript_16253/g.29572 Transcript_16253/m.29572 type:complete len:215 (-) Transcript_16253:374-1018(-)
MVTSSAVTSSNGAAMASVRAAVTLPLVSLLYASTNSSAEPVEKSKVKVPSTTTLDATVAVVEEVEDLDEAVVAVDSVVPVDSVDPVTAAVGGVVAVLTVDSDDEDVVGEEDEDVGEEDSEVEEVDTAVEPGVTDDEDDDDDEVDEADDADDVVDMVNSLVETVLGELDVDVVVAEVADDTLVVDDVPGITQEALASVKMSEVYSCVIMVSKNKG